MTLLQLEVPLVAVSLMKATLTVPQPPEVLPPPAVKSAAGTELKHWTVVFAGQLIVGPVQPVGWVPEMAKISFRLSSGTSLCHAAVFQVVFPGLVGAVAVKVTVAKSPGSSSLPTVRCR